LPAQGRKAGLRATKQLYLLLLWTSRRTVCLKQDGFSTNMVFIVFMFNMLISPGVRRGGSLWMDINIFQ
jgi:hypothetical protein